MKTPLQVTAITNFIWAGEALAGAGFLLARAGSAASAAGSWALAMMSMGVSALVGGIDHGFFEPEGKTPAHRAMEKAKNITAGVIAFFALLTVARQFFGPKAQALFLVIACAQLGAFVVATLLLDGFLVVILDYAPAMILLLVMSLLGLGSGAGSWQMVVGLVISTAASVVQALGVDRFSPLDRNGLYHLILMAATVFLFLGGLALR
jgi:hypothetical protein